MILPWLTIAFPICMMFIFRSKKQERRTDLHDSRTCTKEKLPKDELDCCIWIDCSIKPISSSDIYLIPHSIFVHFFDGNHKHYIDFNVPKDAQTVYHRWVFSYCQSAYYLLFLVLPKHIKTTYLKRRKSSLIQAFSILLKKFSWIWILKIWKFVQRSGYDRLIGSAD